ncbi:hypothetical protein HHK36_008147 [Tetracentron sinense]|uniref:Uncharacterized protein n=1 Tax=Tetracentron sinense TaxID=13715 RepID=A0A835DMY1_TETSI|nr:hypothetical protein HHK36_008147 [Tetracentron sinense]
MQDLSSTDDDHDQDLVRRVSYGPSPVPPSSAASSPSPLPPSPKLLQATWAISSSLPSPLPPLLSLVSTSASCALETLCGQAFGAKKYHMLGIYMQRSWIVMFLCAVLLLPMYVFATPILKLLGQPTDVAEQTGLVSIWLIPVHFSFAFSFPLQRFLQSQLKNAVIAWVSLAALLVHIFISWLFLYKLQFGVIGAAVTLNFS